MSMINWAELQLAVMNVLWRQEPATVHDVIGALSKARGEDKPPAYTTILTVLTNLVRQGYVTSELKEGTRMFQYRTLVTQRDIQEGLAQELIERLFDDSPLELIRLLIEIYPPSTQQTEQIISLLASSKSDLNPDLDLTPASDSRMP